MPVLEAEERQLYAPMDAWESMQNWDEEVLLEQERHCRTKKAESRTTAHDLSTHLIFLFLGSVRKHQM